MQRAAHRPSVSRPQQQHSHHQATTLMYMHMYTYTHALTRYQEHAYTLTHSHTYLHTHTLSSASWLQAPTAHRKGAVAKESSDWCPGRGAVESRVGADGCPARGALGAGHPWEAVCWGQDKLAGLWTSEQGVLSWGCRGGLSLLTQEVAPPLLELPLLRGSLRTQLPPQTPAFGTLLSGQEMGSGVPRIRAQMEGVQEDQRVYMQRPSSPPPGHTQVTWKLWGLSPFGGGGVGGRLNQRFARLLI